MNDAVPRSLLPDTADIGPDGHLSIGGRDVVELVAEFGSPLFIYDEQHLIDRCREAVEGWRGGAAYASKAFLCRAMARIAADAGMSIDVATGGELHVALAAGCDPRSIVMHGNNKSDDEIAEALRSGVGRIVVDSFDEMDRIERLVVDGARVPTVLVRVNPGIEAHTHEYLQTGVTDSKFGFPMAEGIAQAAVDRAGRSAAMDLVGIHVHIGSQVFDVGSYDR
ncbi:MAG: diaminopimelate decarboxylase, partial [Acidimicrobiia bacterium]|nr:diaminopimelate decarboxylase [Acidimicrobiia bacterium]